MSGIISVNILIACVVDKHLVPLISLPYRVLIPIGYQVSVPLRFKLVEGPVGERVLLIIEEVSIVSSKGVGKHDLADRVRRNLVIFLGSIGHVRLQVIVIDYNAGR